MTGVRIAMDVIGLVTMIATVYGLGLLLGAAVMRVAMRTKINRLRDAIRKHRNTRGHERCWVDDRELYAVLGEGQPDLRLPPKDEFLGECARYWALRQHPKPPTT